MCFREDDKHSVDIHDNPPAPDNVVREDGEMVSDITMSMNMLVVPFSGCLKEPPAGTEPLLLKLGAQRKYWYVLNH